MKNKILVMFVLPLLSALSATGAPSAADRFLMKRYGKVNYAEYTLLDRAVRAADACGSEAPCGCPAAAVCRWDAKRARELALQDQAQACDARAPLLGWSLWQVQKATPDRKFLDAAYALLKAQEERCRSKGLNAQLGLFQGACPIGRCSPLACNAGMILHYRALRDFACALGLKADETIWKTRGSELERAYEQRFWDEKDRCYYDLDFSSGAFKRQVTVDSFWPLFLGTATRERAMAMARFDPMKQGQKPLCPASVYQALKGLAFYGYQEVADAGRKALLNGSSVATASAGLLPLLLDWQLPRDMEMPVPFVEVEKNPAWVIRSYWMDGWTSQVSATKTKKYAWICPGDGLYDITGEIMCIDDSLFTGHILLNGKEIAKGRTVNAQSLGIVAAENVTLKAGDKVELELRGTEADPKKINLDAFAVRRRDTVRTQCLSAPDADHVMGLRHHQGIPSVAVSKGGRLWATWYGNVNGCETAENFAVLATSADNGRTWKEVLIADPDLTGLKRAFDPEIWVTPDNRLLWTWSERVAGIYAFGLQRWSGCGADPATDTLYGVYLDAEREPDLAKLPAPFVIGKGVMMCKPIVRKDGSWLLPIAHWYADPSACFYESRDNGKTFAYLGGVTVPEKARTYDEHNVVEFADGSMRTWIRTVGHSGIPGMMESVSSDGGKTWTPAVKGAVPQCSSRIFVTKLKSGNLVMIKNGPKDEFTDRERLTAILSRDNGKTWEGGLLLDERRGVSYPDGCQLTDGSILAIWDRNRTVDLEICTARFTEADILAGGQAKREVLSSPEK